MNSADANKPIVVKRIKKGGEAAHGGAWKVAFADFMTSMLALFIVLWLLESTTPAERMAISMYFTSPTGFTDGGSPFVINMDGGMRNTETIDRVASPAPPTERPGVMPDKDNDADQSKTRANVPTPQAGESKLSPQAKEAQFRKEEDSKFTKMKESMNERIEANPTLRALKDQIIISLHDDGLQIQIVDKKKRPMFDLGKASIKPYMGVLIDEIAKVIKSFPNKISITGHTDSVPFTEEPDYTNWELSADRANAARRAFLKAGVSQKQIARVEGVADSDLYDKLKPDAPINRRTTILVMRTMDEMPKRPDGLDPSIKVDTIEGGVNKGEPQKPVTAASDASAKPGEPTAASLLPGAALAKPAEIPALAPEEKAALPQDEDFPSEVPPPAPISAPVEPAVDTAPAVPASSPSGSRAAPVPAAAETGAAPVDPFEAPINKGVPAYVPSTGPAAAKPAAEPAVEPVATPATEPVPTANPGPAPVTAPATIDDPFAPTDNAVPASPTPSAPAIPATGAGAAPAPDAKPGNNDEFF